MRREMLLAAAGLGAAFFSPGLQLVLTWRFTIILFSVIAGLSLLAVRHQFSDNRGARATR